MKSIINLNTLPRNRNQGWHFRMNEVQSTNKPRLKELACHHTSQLLINDLCNIREALNRHSKYTRMPEIELKAVCVQAHDAASQVFLSCRIAPRIDPAIAAIAKLAGGTLPLTWAQIVEPIQKIIVEMESQRMHYYTRCISSDNRLRIDMTADFVRLVNDIESRIRKLYALAQTRFNLADLYGGAK